MLIGDFAGSMSRIRIGFPPGFVDRPLLVETV
jgi:hypothetical protein